MSTDDDHRVRVLAATLTRAVSVEAVLRDPDEPELARCWGQVAPRLAAELGALDRLGASWITPLDHAWPVGAPPGVLRVLGRLPPAGLGVVGARRADPYGLDLATAVARTAVNRGYAVVSGGAYGIDRAAHVSALAAGGRTVVVLGAGLDHPTPCAHAEVFAWARVEGAVVSPFPCAWRAARWTFPRRNPWIAALSHTLVVVQASSRSGALHTVRAAHRLGRPVYAAPGLVGSPLHAGCHQPP